MKSFKDIREEYNTLLSEKKKEEKKEKIPAIIVLRRKSVRQFPEGSVALYQADKINKLVSVPFVSAGVDQLTENNIEKLQEISESTQGTLHFQDGKNIQITNTLAKGLITLYESLNTKNKKKMYNMINESIDSFKKVSSFIVRQS